MTIKHAYRSVLLVAGALSLAACASQTLSPNQTLDDRYFEREANNYLKFTYDGQTVYCQDVVKTASLIPHKRCITETALRQRVADLRRSRNAVVRGGPPYVSTVPGAVGGR